MSILETIAIVVLSVFLIGWLIHYFKVNPGAFSGKNISRSFFTMGILALILIAFIWVLVMFART
jgi:hypothetical protein